MNASEWINKVVRAKVQPLRDELSFVSYTFVYSNNEELMGDNIKRQKCNQRKYENTLI